MVCVYVCVFSTFKTLMMIILFNGKKILKFRFMAVFFLVIISSLELMHPNLLDNVILFFFSFRVFFVLLNLNRKSYLQQPQISLWPCIETRNFILVFREWKKSDLQFVEMDTVFYQQQKKNVQFHFIWEFYLFVFFLSIDAWWFH